MRRVGIQWPYTVPLVHCRLTAKRELTQAWCKTEEQFCRSEERVIPAWLDHAVLCHTFKRPIAEVEQKLPACRATRSIESSLACAVEDGQCCGYAVDELSNIFPVSLGVSVCQIGDPLRALLLLSNQQGNIKLAILSSPSHSFNGGYSWPSFLQEFMKERICC
jgi:hypothetical protein